MEFRKLRLQIIIRLLLILAIGYTAIYVALHTYFWLSSIWLGLICAGMIYLLIHYLESNYKDLSYFLSSLKQDDFLSLKQGKHSNPNFIESYKIISDTIQRLRAEKETQHTYLETIVKHINLPIICFDANDRVSLINKAANNFFGSDSITSIHYFHHLNKELFQKLKSIETGSRELIKLRLSEKSIQLFLSCTQLKMEGELYKIISFQDIKSELEATELEAWQKLIRVITHEIMNSAIPLSNLSALLRQSIDEKEKNQRVYLQGEDLEDFKGCLQTIENRSKALVNFTKATKSLSQIKEPDFQKISIKELWLGIDKLISPILLKEKIQLVVSLEERLELHIDKELIEQVLINLLLNAKEALSETNSPQIDVNAFREGDKILIQVLDNGIGIQETELETVFTPFYTSKEKGSGIGLSLSKQIMQLHAGAIQLNSIPNEGTTLSLIFNS